LVFLLSYENRAGESNLVQRTIFLELYKTPDNYQMNCLKYRILHMVGTVAGNLITGDITSAIGDGTFYLEYPSTAPFGHLLLEGNVGDREIYLDTEYCLGSGPSVEEDGDQSTHFEAHFSNHELNVWVWLGVSGTVPDIGEADLPLTYNVPDVWIDLEWTQVGQEPWDTGGFYMDTGSLTLTRFDTIGLAGTFDFGDPLSGGDWLSGSFDLSWWNERSPEDD
jgi:hypothetical protein